MFFNCFYDSHSVKECHHRLHCDSTAAHLSRIIAEIVKRLKDSDSGVRDACGDTIGALSRIYLKGDNTGDVVGVFVKQLFAAMGGRNKVVQSGAAMCMARMVESAASPPIFCFQKLCPRICKLLRDPSFLAKDSLLAVVSSLSKVGAIEHENLESLLESIHDCLASTDWVTRKAAADTLTALASHSSSLIKDKTDFTLDLLEKCWFDKIKHVRESVTEALQLWKTISGKSEQLGSEKKEEKRSDLMASDGSTFSLDSPIKGKEGLPEKEALVMLKNKVPALSDKEVFQRPRQEPERRQSVKVVFPHRCKNNDEEERLERRQSQAVEVVFPYRCKNNETGSSNRFKADDDGIPDSKFHKQTGTCGVVPGNQVAAVSDTDSQYERCSFGSRGYCSAIQRQVLQLERLETSRMKVLQELNDDSMEEGRVRRVGRANDEEAVRVDREVTQVAAAVLAAEAKGNKGHLIRTSWRNAIHALGVGDIKSAYAEVFGANDLVLIIMLMEKTGPAFHLMSHEIGNKAVSFISKLLDHKLNSISQLQLQLRICVSWIQQLLEVLLQAGSGMFGIPMDLKTEILYNLQQACPRMAEREQLLVPTLVVQLAYTWDVHFQINASS